MSTDTTDEVAAKKGHIRQVMIAAGCLGISYVLVEIFLAVAIVSIAWSQPREFRYIIPGNDAYLLIFVLVPGVMVYDRLEILHAGITADRLRFLKVICQAILLAVVLSSVFRIAIYSNHLQDALPRNMSLKKNVAVNEFLFEAMEGREEFDICRKELDFDYPRFRKSVSEHCKLTDNDGYEFNKNGQAYVENKVLGQVYSTRTGLLYGAFEILAFIGISLLSAKLALRLRYPRVVTQNQVQEATS